MTPVNSLRVLIVGGAGGVGRACAVQLARRGAELILCDINGAALCGVACRLAAFTRYCDAVDENSVAIFASEIAAKYPSIDVLINAAGRGYVRSLGMIRMTRAMMPLLKSGAGPRLLVNIAPAGGFVSGDGMFPYSSSLRSFHGLCAAIKDQARGTSIEVVTLTPTLLPMAANICDEPRPYRLERADEEDVARRVIALIDGSPSYGSAEVPKPMRRIRRSG